MRQALALRSPSSGKGEACRRSSSRICGASASTARGKALGAVGLEERLRARPRFGPGSAPGPGRRYWTRPWSTRSAADRPEAAVGLVAIERQVKHVQGSLLTDDDEQIEARGERASPSSTSTLGIGLGEREEALAVTKSCQRCARSWTACPGSRPSGPSCPPQPVMTRPCSGADAGWSRAVRRFQPSTACNLNLHQRWSTAPETRVPSRAPRAGRIPAPMAQMTRRSPRNTSPFRRRRGRDLVCFAPGECSYPVHAGVFLERAELHRPWSVPSRCLDAGVAEEEDKVSDEKAAKLVTGAIYLCGGAGSAARNEYDFYRVDQQLRLGCAERLQRLP